MGVVVGRLNDHLMSAHTVHHVIEALSTPVHTPLNVEHCELVRNDPHGPARAIGAGGRRTYGLYLRRRHVLVPRAERTELRRGNMSRVRCRLRLLVALHGEDHPSVGERVFAKNRHRALVASCFLAVCQAISVEPEATGWAGCALLHHCPPSAYALKFKKEKMLSLHSRSLRNPSLISPRLIMK